MNLNKDDQQLSLSLPANETLVGDLTSDQKPLRMTKYYFKISLIKVWFKIKKKKSTVGADLLIINISVELWLRETVHVLKANWFIWF